MCRTSVDVVHTIFLKDWKVILRECLDCIHLSDGYKLTFSECKFYALTDSERMTGFIGLSSNLIEMLFIDDSFRGKGYGSALIDFALKQGATKVDVNEQNVSALNFYQARGFRIIGRDETDEAGRPYPILHLSL